jgi:steroid 5-alpha reductase family enzyme
MMAHMDALTVNLYLCALACVVTWILSVITKDTSWVDRIWSIIPVVYLWVFAAGSGFGNSRLVAMACLVTLWGSRLTFNFARKGGYRPGGEDYRWQVLRSRMSARRFQLFNVFFIVILQNMLLLLITLPALTVLQYSAVPFGLVDVLLVVLFLGLLAMETAADQQQWRFHSWKRREIAAGRVPIPPFLTAGLFRYSRHPNFFAEQAQWWVFYLFAVTAAGGWLNWTILGAVLLSALFVGSLRFTEEISLSKYPDYAAYQASTSPLIPWLPVSTSRGLR